jgi:dTDP-L-rhamnose 4-epimerase
MRAAFRPSQEDWMPEHILVTGGAGFIGSHLADELLRRGHRVRALDNLDPQVHGADAKRPSYLNGDVELVVGDVRDRDAVRRALIGIDAVYHFAAAVGVGQSMYEIARYTDVNNMGTAVLLEALAKKPVRRLIVASSMSVYGEGYYRAPGGRVVGDAARTLSQLKAGRWELTSENGEPLAPMPTDETKTPSLASVYALSKFDQERLCLTVGRAYGMQAVGLRFFNVYGPRQALSNPYTGVLAIFASRLLNNRAPLINEDGEQTRDFVSVHDVARASALALEAPNAPDRVFNIGSGAAHSVNQVAERIATALDKHRIRGEVTGKYRVGDIRHCFPDITLARRVLGYAPEVSLEKGLQELAAWLPGHVALDRVESARAELETRGLAL